MVVVYHDDMFLAIFDCLPGMMDTYCQLPWRAPIPWHRAENESVSRTVISAKCMSSWLTYAAHLCGINSSIIRPLKTRLVTFRAESSCPAKANNKEVLPDPGGPNSNVNLQLRVVRSNCSVLRLRCEFFIY
ncbi:hypothetical protein EJB05_16372, partial [Eragrostis curvula]